MATTYAREVTPGMSLEVDGLTHVIAEVTHIPASPVESAAVWFRTQTGVILPFYAAEKVA